MQLFVIPMQKINRIAQIINAACLALSAGVSSFQITVKQILWKLLRLHHL